MISFMLYCFNVLKYTPTPLFQSRNRAELPTPTFPKNNIFTIISKLNRQSINEYDSIRVISKENDMTEKEIMIENMYKKIRNYEYEKQCTESKYMKADLDRAIKNVEKKIQVMIWKR